LLLVPKSLLHGTPITATAQDLHLAQYLQPHTGKKTMPRPPPHPPKKSSKLYHIAILVPHYELVMKSYMPVWLATAETQYHNLNANTKNQDYWFLTSNVGIMIQNCSKGLKNPGLFFPHFGHFQFAEWYKVKTVIWYTSNSISWLPSD